MTDTTPALPPLPPWRLPSRSRASGRAESRSGGPNRRQRRGCWRSVAAIVVLAGVGRRHPLLTLSSTVDHLDVEGVRHLDPPTVRRGQRPEGASTCSTSTRRVAERNLLELPWVRRVSVTRRWPTPSRSASASGSASPSSTSPAVAAGGHGRRRRGRPRRSPRHHPPPGGGRPQVHVAVGRALPKAVATGIEMVGALPETIASKSPGRDGQGERRCGRRGSRPARPWCSAPARTSSQKFIAASPSWVVRWCSAAFARGCERAVRARHRTGAEMFDRRPTGRPCW